MKKRPARTVLEVCIARGGMWRGAKVQTFIAEWTIASQAMGQPIEDVRDFAEWWRMPQSTAYRQLAHFRDVFPELRTPQPIADAAIDRAEEWVARGVAGFAQLPAAVVPA